MYFGEQEDIDLNPFEYLEQSYNDKLSEFDLDMLLSENTFKTFDEWKRIGLCVKKGEKSIARNHANNALFSGKQVREPQLFFINKSHLTEENEKLKKELLTIKNSKSYKLLHKMKLI